MLRKLENYICNDYIFEMSISFSEETKKENELDITSKSIYGIYIYIYHNRTKKNDNYG